jgi:hypothetical protein
MKPGLELCWVHSMAAAAAAAAAAAGCATRRQALAAACWAAMIRTVCAADW